MKTVVDLRSDTVTKPPPGMREAMACAEVGDDVLGEDPSVNALQQRAVELLGKEAALFVPTGTMANLVAVLSQTRPGDAVILSEDAHPVRFESGNIAMVAGVQARTVTNARGILSPEDVTHNYESGHNHHYAPTTLVSIENTTNRGGGAIYPLATVEAIAAAAHECGMRVHMDGARLFNAVVATGVSVADYARHADTVSFCLSKGLGAPAGSLLAGDAATIDRAHRFRKMLGGGMRQAGILAAAGLYALEHNIERLADDHRRARQFREGLEGTTGLAFPLPSPTNIVYVDVADAQIFVERLADAGVLASVVASGRIRAVFHLDVDDIGVECAVAAFRAVARRT